jgi:ethanolamine ammonia-lyase small subunit
MTNFDKVLLDKTVDHLKSLTPARIGVGRAGGTRPPTTSRLQFLADHAFARDAVRGELDNQFAQDFCEKYQGIVVQTEAESRSDYILYPPKGKRLSAETLKHVEEGARAKAESFDIQVVVADGLSPQAAEYNAPNLYPMLVDGFEDLGLTLAPPVVVRYGRVAVADQIAHAVKASLAINLLGERPGLSCAVGLSAYLTYNPNPKTTISSDRTVVSNIHDAGTPAIEAGAFIVKVAARILSLKISGVKLQSSSES